MTHAAVQVIARRYRRGFAACLVAGAMLLVSAVNARAEAFFDRAFGVDVDPSDGDPGDFENCTTICQSDTPSGSAGGMKSPEGVAVDALGRILVADSLYDRLSRFTLYTGSTGVPTLSTGMSIVLALTSLGFGARRLRGVRAVTRRRRE